MCFRPSAAVGNKTQLQTGTCPTCGEPVAASIGITSGTCPYCGKSIPADNLNEHSSNNSNHDVRIL